ncbi:MAG: GspE/PulE family protein [Betaproteobacteria bacterium]|nr:GspE/PulE family protein [Betaproteobacteria bacterium]
MEAAGSHDVQDRLEFSRRLQAITNKIHATENAEEIMVDLSRDICDLVGCDRLTIYMVGEDRQTLLSKVKTGLDSIRQIKLAISDQSIAGYVAMTRKGVNISDVYNEAELKSLSPQLRFLREVDQRTGYRTRQLLVEPIIDGGGELVGVLQFINNRDGSAFPKQIDDAADLLAQTLAVALTQRQKPRQAVRSKYDGLVTDGVLHADELNLARRAARQKGRDLEEVLIKEFQVKPADIGHTLAGFFGVPYEAFRPGCIKPTNLLKNLKRDYVEGSLWLPVEENAEGIVVVSPDPERVRMSRIVENVFPKSHILHRVTTVLEFRQYLDLFYGALADLQTVGDVLSELDDEPLPEGAAASDDLSAAADNELVRLVNTVIIEAHRQGASDIHIEPRQGREKTIIRFRKDGILAVHAEVPASYRNALVARIKIMCDLDISEKRRPQDGKIKFKKFGPLDIELRVATIPTAGGMEDVVMRILAAGEPIPLDQLGVAPGNLSRLKEVISKPYGLFFVCGPTGSGKTTTLHSILHHINTPETKIWTAEDPVEITQKGLRQVQINKKAGLDFATIMRAFLRADPDVIMVGEMRDRETVAIGIEASLTGHLVFATLHTNSAPESINRLLDMGMDPFNFADALLGILAQRLARRLCKSCKEAYSPDDAEIRHLIGEYSEELGETPIWKKDPAAAGTALFAEWQKNYAKDGKFTLYRAKGCEACGDTGYKGRVGLHELLVGSDALKKQIQEHARVAELLATALAEGMHTLKMDGIEKVLAGVTDMKQVRAVCIK